MTLIRGNHHLTLSVGGAQEDFDFHTGLLGLRPIKKTVLYDGTAPIYHLYYGNASGDAGAIITCFPMRQLGLLGRAGSNQVKLLNLSVPDGSLDWWANRLDDNAWRGSPSSCSGCAGSTSRTRAGSSTRSSARPTARRTARRGVGTVCRPSTGSVAPTGSLPRCSTSTRWITTSRLGSARRSSRMRALVAATRSARPGRAAIVELVHEPDVRPGTWHFAEGTVHHVAYNIGDADAQQEAKAHIEGIGYTDVTEMKDRGYFFSVYNRSPGGPLVELAWSKDEGWLIDEPAETLGTAFMLPPQFEHQRAEILGALEPLVTD